MPPTSRAQSVVGVLEVIDGAEPIDPSAPNTAMSGQAMSARASALSSFHGFGPPDMLYIRKRYTPVVGASGIYGSYHFVRGVNTSHVAAISAYIVDVVRNKGLDPLPWVSAGGWEIASATFVAYNVLSKADAIVHVDFPGSTTATATGADGRPLELSDLFWAELMVSSMVRDHAGSGEAPLYPCLHVLSPSSALQMEAVFFDAAADCSNRWHLSGTESLLGETSFAFRSRVATEIRDGLINSARYDAAIEFFQRPKVCEADRDCAVHAASAARMKGDFELATSIVDGILLGNPDSQLALLESAKIHRSCGELRKALEVAKKAASNPAESIDVWIVLADLHVDLKEYRLAFIALNSANMPQPSLDHFLRGLLPNRKNLTSPVSGHSQGNDAVRVLANQLREERNMSDQKTDGFLADLPGKLMTDVERSCYAVLVKILNDLSWDDMLAVRGECFVMQADVENGQDSADLIQEDNGNSDSDDSSSDSEASNPGDSNHPNGQRLRSSDDPLQEESDNGLKEDGGLSGSEKTQTRVDVESLPNEESSSRATPVNGSPSSDQSEASNGKSSLKKISEGKTGKQVCKPWLDYLVLNMFKDLRAMATWNDEEQRHSAAAALKASAQVKRSQKAVADGDQGSSSSFREDVESQDLYNDYRRSADEVAATTRRPSADWLRRGELALRLGKTEEARTAFWTCIKLAAKEKIVAVTSLCRIVKLASDDGDARTTLRCADAIWSYLDASTDRKTSSKPTSPVVEVRACVFRIIAKKGLRAVRDTAVSKVEIDVKRMEGLLLDSVALQVDGFSR